MIDATASHDPDITTKIREFHATAVAAGYSDPLWGALVIAAMVIVGLEDELAAARHPKGRASVGV